MIKIAKIQILSLAEGLEGYEVYGDLPTTVSVWGVERFIAQTFHLTLIYIYIHLLSF